MEKNPHIENPHMLSKDEAVRRIMGIMQTVFQGGSVDSERDVFMKIIEQLESNELSPEDAVRRAEQISSSRQDYH